MADDKLGIWCLLDRIGGLGGTSIYFNQVRAVKKVFAGFKSLSNDKMVSLDNIYSKEHDIDKFLGYGSSKTNPRITPRRYGEGEETKIVEIAYLVELDKSHRFLKVENNSILDDFIELEKNEKEFLSKYVFDIKDIGLLFREHPQLTMLHIKEGKIQSISRKRYDGVLEKLDPNLKEYVDKIPKP